MTRALVYGLAQTGQAVARALQRHDVDVVAADDRRTPAVEEAASALGVDLVVDPDADALDRLLAAVDLVAPAPGVPETHRLIAAAGRAGVPVRSELDLAYDWEQGRPGGPRPMLAVTGTDGKTTTTLLTAAMLTAAGHRVAAAGNTELPLVDALEHDVDAFVVECSSFRLAFVESFRAEASAWLNLAEDHLNWHPDLPAYEAAKARLWAHVRPDDVAVGWGDDPVVVRHLRAARCRRRTFARAGADYRLEGGTLTGPAGMIAAVTEMRRALPHDLTNALAASALALESGLASTDDVAAALETFDGPPHRIQLIADVERVRWYDDSKATTPHAALTAIRAFDSLVLIAGGRNKGLDLAPLGSEAGRVRAVVAIGEAAPEVSAAFAGRVPVQVATSMADAVEAAAGLAVAGDAVVLSPACASFDWYGSYGERGDDFARCVREYLGEGATTRGDR